jgi:hypothetical protein
MPNFPTSPEALTNEWLGEKLGVPVTGFKVDRLGEGAGLLGLVTKVSLDYDASAGEPGPATVIAKFPTPSADNRVVADTFDMYGREVRFYQNLASKTPARAPRSYAAELDGDSSDFVLLLEDLSYARFGEQTKGCGLKDGERSIDQMIKLNSTWWDKTDSPGLEWLPLHDNPTQCAGISHGFNSGWEPFLEGFGDTLPAGKVEQFAKVGPAIEDLHRMLCTGARTVVHGDFRLDNMFIGVDDDPDMVALFDWQAIAVSSGAHDLGYFMSQSLLTEERRKHQDVLLHRFHDGICESGVTNYSFDQLFEDYRIASLYFFSYAVLIAGTLDLSNERGLALARVLGSRSSACIDDIDALDLLP